MMKTVVGKEYKEVESPGVSVRQLSKKAQSYPISKKYSSAEKFAIFSTLGS